MGRVKSKLKYNSPKRRWTDRIRALADDLWALGRKKEAQELHNYASRKEDERKKEAER